MYYKILTAYNQGNDFFKISKMYNLDLGLIINIISTAKSFPIIAA